MSLVAFFLRLRDDNALMVQQNKIWWKKVILFRPKLLINRHIIEDR
jgi:hypothetical protein